MDKRKTRILVVDDHQIVRQGLELLINGTDDLEICGESDSQSTALRAIRSLMPDMVIVDLSLTNGSGFELIKIIRERYKNLPILVLSMHEKSIYAERALRAGASGYVMKREASKTVMSVIRSILDGDIHANDQARVNLLQQPLDGTERRNGDPVKRLSNQEISVLRLVGKGWTRQQIADELTLSVKTVESYRERVKEKLSLTNAAELIQNAIQWRQDGTI